MEKVIRRSIIAGSARAPPSIPAAHRALVAALLSRGQSVIGNLPSHPAISATIAACRALGADIVVENGTADVFGTFFIPARVSLDCAGSNATFKLFMPLAAIFEGEVKFSGLDGIEPECIIPHVAYLERLGASVEAESEQPPLTVRGPISERELVFRASLGTPFFSGFLFALPLLEDDSSIAIDGSFYSQEHIEETFRILDLCQIVYQHPSEEIVLLQGGQEFIPFRYELPSSESHAGFLALAGAIGGSARIEGKGSYARLVKLLSSFGAEAKESEGSIEASALFLKGRDISAQQVGSLLPHAIVLACLAEGRTNIEGTNMLLPRAKRRMWNLVQELSKMGARIENTPSGLSIEGGKLSGAQIEPKGDPMVAMACSVAAIACQGQTRIMGAECVEKTYPAFFSDLASLGALVR
ncbi:MAG: hypothetical protein N3E51_01855 [Candidatus Micrarchaeota archaeon]|nr:hypothetical protein [Candidatus Micrarchaeota archaeon]